MDYFIAERDIKKAQGYVPQYTALSWRKPNIEPWRVKYEQLCRATPRPTAGNDVVGILGVL